MTDQDQIGRLRTQTIHVLQRARKLPPGTDRNDLRQLALGLRQLERRHILQTTNNQLESYPEAQLGQEMRVSSSIRR